MKFALPLLFIVGSVLTSAPASARSHRVNQLPHGGSFGCTSCHTSPGGGGVFTGFGSEATLHLVGDGHISTRDLDWAPMASLDSDRDGFTNGEEVGDPEGTWSIGDPDPSGRFHNPGDPNDHPIATCGDGRVTPPEECDGDNFAGLSCFGLGLDEGTLRCKSDCSFDRSGCGPQADAGPATGTPDMGGTGSDAGADDTACTVVPQGAPTPTAHPGWLLLLAGFLLRRRLTARGA